MADKIVQLIDKNGDNIFPVATVANGATITMTDIDPGEGSALGDNEYVAVYGGAPIIMDYSTNEVNTGTKWIDGSVIYKKTINFGALPNNTSKNVAHDINSLGNIIKIDGVASTTSNNTTTPLPFVGDSSSYDVCLTVDNTNVQITTHADRTAYSAYITLYYTKSA